MKPIRFTMLCALAVVFVAQFAAAGVPSNWISLSQATNIAKLSVPGGVPIKAELDTDGGLMRYEIKIMNNGTLYKIKIHPVSGAVQNISTSSGGGAQSEMSVAQQILSQSPFSLLQAMAIGQSPRPNYYLREIDIRYRNGVGVFHLELLRGTMELELEYRASDGVLVHQNLYGVSNTQPYFGIYNGNPPPLWNSTNFIPIQLALVKNQLKFPGAAVYKAELSPGFPVRYEIEMFKAGQLIKAKYNAFNGNFISSEIKNDPSLKAKVIQSYGNVQIPFGQAVNTARLAVPTGFVVEAKLRLQENGVWYQVRVQTKAGYVQVFIKSATGVVTKMQYTTN